jgi:hypothetical protein
LKWCWPLWWSISTSAYDNRQNSKINAQSGLFYFSIN